MNYLILGSTGYIGRNLVYDLINEGHNVFVHSRNKDKAFDIFGKKVSIVNWDDLKHNHLKINLSTVECVINLAGESIAAHRWTPKTKSKILNSRINAIHLLLKSIQKKIITPKVLINASAIGYYGTNDSDILTESSGAGDGFLAKVCEKWEYEALKAESYGIRVVLIRTGIVLGYDGALKKMTAPYKIFLGGRLGSGKQWMSWIHIDDLVDIYKKASTDINMNNAINATAPNAVTMQEFSKTLGKTLNKPSIINVPSFILKKILGDMSEIIIKGQRVYPEKLITSGFKFSYPTLPVALENILKK